MPMKRTITTTTTTETLPPIVTYETRSRRSLDVGSDDVISKGTLSRRQDQKIKDDITNKLYRLEMDQVKPGQDVQLRTAIFRSIRPSVIRTRHLTPEPVTRVLSQVATPSITRRYSIVGDLGYRPIGGDVIVEKVEPLKDTVSRPFTEYYTSYDWQKARQPDTEYISLRKAEPNASRYEQTTVYRALSTPPSHSEPLRRPYASAPQPTQNNGVKQALNDSKRDLSDFEKLMKKTFGPYGGVNKTSTPMYTAPPYHYPYYYTTPDYYRNYYTTAPDYYRHYYTTTPRYSTYCPTLDTLPDYYTYRYNPKKSLDYDYILYSPPTRVTSPPSLNYYSYYDHPLHSLHYIPSTSTHYSLIR